MVLSVKRNKKILSKKMAREKGFEIPVYVVKNDVRLPVAPSAKSEPAEIQARKNRTSGFKIVKDENDLPVFEKIAEQNLPVKNQKKEPAAAADVAKNVSVAAAGQKFAAEKKPARPPTKIKKEKAAKKFLSAKNGRKKEKRQNIFAELSEKSKMRVLWTSVAIIVCLIFFVWLSFLKENFSFNFNSKNSQNLSITNDAGNALGDLKNQWNNLRSGWSDFGNVLKQRTSAGASQEVVDKLKEKVLVEEMRDKIFNSSTQGGSAPGGQFPISNEKTE